MWKEASVSHPGAEQPVFRQMPDPVRELARSWRTLVGVIPGLTAELEQEFRFGRSVAEFLPGEYRIGGSIKGGSSAIWSSAGPSEYEAYRQWCEVEGFLPLAEPEVKRAALVAFLKSFGIELEEPGEPERAARRGQRRGQIYALMREILAQLPPEHLASPHLRVLQLGGQGPDTAKCSAFEGDRLILYEFALRGARRTFAGLFLHELGHAHGASIRREELPDLRAAHRAVAASGALLGLEYLLDPQSRQQYQDFPLGEFLAETYLAYTAAGSLLRQHLAGLAPDQGRRAFEEVYAFFQRSFGGIEYE